MQKFNFWREKQIDHLVYGSIYSPQVNPVQQQAVCGAGSAASLQRRAGTPPPSVKTTDGQG